MYQSHCFEIKNAAFIVLFLLSLSTLCGQFNVNKVENLSIESNTPGSLEGSFEFQDKLYFLSENSQQRGLAVYDGNSLEAVKDNENFIWNVRGNAIFQGQVIISADVSKQRSVLETSSETGSELYSFDGSSFTLIEDINATGSSRSFGSSNFLEYKGKLYFSAHDGESGDELWSYDGVNLEEIDLLLGATGSTPRNLTIFQNKLFFTAAGSSSTGTELWYTDGSQFELVGDIQAGPGSSNPRNLTVAGSYLYFSADDGSSGQELWSYDGNTLAMVDDIATGSQSSSPSSLISINNSLYFHASNESSQTRLNKVTGLTITEINDFGGSNVSLTTSLNETLLLNAFNNDGTISLYTYNTLNSISELIGEGFLQNPVISNNSLLFNLSSDFFTHSEIYKYDGSTLSIEAEVPSDISFPNFVGARSFKGETIWFSSFNSLRLDFNGSRGFENNNLGLSDAFKTLETFSVVENNFIFTYCDQFEEDIIYTIGEDGVEQEDFQLNAPDSLFTELRLDNFFSFQGRFYFVTRQQNSPFQRYLSSVDFVSSSFDIGLPIDGTIRDPVTFNNKVYFALDDRGPLGEELYEFDGVSLSLVEDFQPGPDDGVVSEIIEYQGDLYFICLDDGTFFEFCRFNGSTIEILHTFMWQDGTRFVMNDNMIIYNDELFMSSINTNGEEELFVYDGISVQPVSDLNGSSGSRPTNFHVLDDGIYFQAITSDLLVFPGTGLYRYDGSSTTRLNSAGVAVNSILGVFENNLILSITTEEEGQDLGWYDGNSISILEDIAPGCNSSMPIRGANYEGKFYFTANDGLNGQELYVIDPNDCSEHLAVHYPIVGIEEYEAEFNIQLVGSAVVENGEQLTVSANRSIELQNGFGTEKGGILQVDNDGCNN